MGCSSWASQERVPTRVLMIARWANGREGDGNLRKIFAMELSWANHPFDGKVW
jgi:hypothetical protein